MPLMAGKPFCALVPEQDLSASVRHRHADLQAVQHGAEHLWILKVRHRSLEGAAGILIGRKRTVLQAADLDRAGTGWLSGRVRMGCAPTSTGRFQAPGSDSVPP